MKQIMVFLIVGIGAVVLVRAALDTALVVPRIAAESKKRASW